MVQVLAGMFGDEMGVLTADRRDHSLAVGLKAAGVAVLVPASLRADMVTAATLHDIGYGHPASGFHALDGAEYLRSAGFSAAVCHLVVHHSASSLEAEERGLDLALYDTFAVDEDLSAAHAVIWWADMTTGPQGQDVAVEDRLAEICERYGPDDLVTRFIRLHDLRHTAACLWLSRGVDLSTVSAWLGHASITTTNRYLHYLGRVCCTDR